MVTSSYYVLVTDSLYSLMTTAHEEPGGGQDGGCVDEVTQETLSKTCLHASIMNIVNS